MYSNSKYDLKQQDAAANDDTGSVKNMYEYAPYPDLGADLKDPSEYTDHIMADLLTRKNVRYLEAGCGTGHNLVGAAKKNPNWVCSGIDLSSASLGVAKELAEKHSVKVDLYQGSYLEPLPFEKKSFDVVTALGTIHHCSNPLGAMNNLASYMKDDGWMLMHMYGMRCDRKKFDIKEMLDIFEPDITNYNKRFEIYDAYVKNQKKDIIRYLSHLSVSDIYQIVKNKIRNIRRKRSGITWSPAFTEKYESPTSPWIDHFCHPCERAYEVRDLQNLIEASGFEVVYMLGQGKENINLVPQEWREDYQNLNFWDRARLQELFKADGGSFRMILQKKK